MNFEKELNKLNEFVGGDPGKFIDHVKMLKENFTSDEEIKIIEDAAEKALKDFTNEIVEFTEMVNVKIQLASISDMISLSYIAKHYFHKTRQWLYQRINGEKVNGKPAKFTPEEIKTLNFALKDISKKIGSINIV